MKRSDETWMFFFWPILISLSFVAFWAISSLESKSAKARACVRECMQSGAWPCSDRQYKCKLRGICEHVQEEMEAEWLLGLDPYGLDNQTKAAAA